MSSTASFPRLKSRSFPQKVEKRFNNSPGEYGLYQITRAMVPKTPATMTGTEPSSLSVNVLLVLHQGHIAQRDHRRRRSLARRRRKLKLFTWNKQSDPEIMFQFLRDAHREQNFTTMVLLNYR